jgi:AcrR family transcriptional regulator
VPRVSARPASSKRSTSQGERTREQLLDAAERLMAERGVTTASLREIRLVAGQRNTSAMQFHFGGREGLVRALVDRHLPRQAVLQQALYDSMVRDGRDDDVRSLVEVLIRPGAEYLEQGPGARAWVRICAELAAHPEREIGDFLDNIPAAAVVCLDRLFRRLSEQMPKRVANERLMIVSQSALHACADRARLEDAAEPGRPTLPLDEFIDDLVDMAHGALTAPTIRRAASASSEGAAS